jgi:hypothetical protein
MVQKARHSDDRGLYTGLKGLAVQPTEADFTASLWRLKVRDHGTALVAKLQGSTSSCHLIVTQTCVMTSLQDSVACSEWIIKFTRID